MYFRQLRIHHDMVLVQTANKRNWGNFEIFRVIFASFLLVLSAFFERYVYLVLK